MKEKLLFCISLLFLLTGGMKAQTQDPIADGLIKVSNETNEYWYYIENGHNMDEYINDKDGRFCTVVTSKGTANATSEPVMANAKRDVQKWKVVDAGETYYYLVNQKGEYLAANGSRYNVSTSATDVCKFNFKRPITTSDYVAFAKKGATDSYVGMDGNGTFGLANSSLFPGIDDNGLTKWPRAWRFVEESKMEALYPAVYNSTDNIINWYYITSLNPNIADEVKYLTYNSDTKTFSLEKKSVDGIDENQLFGFVDGGYVGLSIKTIIIAKGNGEYLSMDETVLKTTATLPQEEKQQKEQIELRHVYSIKNAAQPMQAVIRSTRYSTGKILSSASTIPCKSWQQKMTTYNNEYTWAFEKVAPSTVEVEGTNGVIVNSSTKATVEYNQDFTVSYTVPEGTSPVVTINNGESPIGKLIAPDTYELTVKIKGKTSIIITSEVPQNAVAVTAIGVDIQSPPLDNENKFVAGSSAIIEFTLVEGYENPMVEVVGATEGDLQFDASRKVYSVALNNFTAETTTVAITATKIVLGVNIISNNGIVLDPDKATSVTYGENYSLSFTATDGYHVPMVIVNNENVSPVLDENVYTVTLPKVKEEQTILVIAFPENMIPVVADTYVNHQAVSDKPHTSAQLWVQYSGGDYTRRSYLEFDPSKIKNIEDYNSVQLRVISAGVQIKKEENDTPTEFHVRSVPNTLNPISTMSWTDNGESKGANFKGEEISSNTVTWILKDAAAGGDVLSLNITGEKYDYLLANSTKESLRLQLAGMTNGDGTFYFHSREGAIAKNIDYIPVLIFEKYYNVTTTANTGITITQSPTGESPYAVKEGESFKLEFALEDGYTFGSVTGADCTGPDEDGGYTISIARVTEDIEISINAVAQLTNEGTSTNLILEGTWHENVFGNILTSLSAANITSIDISGINITKLPTIAELPAIAGLNPNCLVYTSADAESVSGLTNYINGTSAITPIVLTDKKPFNCPTAITLTNGATYTRDCYTDGGWETLILPFDCDTPTDYQVEEFDNVNSDGNLVFKTSTTLAANVGYILKYTGTSETQKGVAFTAASGSTMQTNPATSGLVGVFADIDGEGKYYLDSKGEFFGIGAKGKKVPAFRAYYDAGVKPTRQLSVIHEGGATGIEPGGAATNSIYSLDGVIYINSAEAQTINVYTIDGRKVYSQTVEAGETTIEGLAGGLYIVNNTKVAVQ